MKALLALISLLGLYGTASMPSSVRSQSVSYDRMSGIDLMDQNQLVDHYEQSPLDWMKYQQALEGQQLYEADLSQYPSMHAWKDVRIFGHELGNGKLPDDDEIDPLNIFDYSSTPFSIESVDDVHLVDDDIDDVDFSIAQRVGRGGIGRGRVRLIGGGMIGRGGGIGRRGGIVHRGFNRGMGGRSGLMRGGVMIGRGGMGHGARGFGRRSPHHSLNRQFHSGFSGGFGHGMMRGANFNRQVNRRFNLGLGLVGLGRFVHGVDGIIRAVGGVDGIIRGIDEFGKLFHAVGGVKGIIRAAGEVGELVDGVGELIEDSVEDLDVVKDLNKWADSIFGDWD